MKKLFLLALVAVFALTGMAFAENRVEVKVTSEPIQYKSTCDKAGGFTLEFDSDSTIVAGDQITIDTDFGVTLCRDIDLEISPAGGGTRWVTGNIPATSSPVIDGGTNGVTSAGAGVYFRLFGIAGTQRITLSVLGEVGVDSLVVGSAVDDYLIIAFLDQRTNADFAQPGLWTDLDENDVYTDVALLADNTLCINVFNFDFYTVNGNMDSAFDKFTFIPSNPQIAHVVAAVDYLVRECEKVDTGRIEIGDLAGQGGNDNCAPFDWETAMNYCAGSTAASPSNRNMFMVETTSASTFYSAGDYQVEMTIETPGVYWTDDTVTGESYTSFQNACLDRMPDAVAFTADYYTRNGVLTTPIPFLSNDCTFVEEPVTLVSNCVSSLVATGNRRVVSFDIPAMKYDVNEITLGEEVIVTVKLIKCPCGEIWEETVNVGTLDCIPAEGPTFSLLYPYMTAMSGDIWWDGFVVTNVSSEDGTATVYFYEKDGDQGQMVVSVPAQGMFVNTLINMLNAPVGGQVVQAMTQSAGTGTLGDAQCYGVVCTDFNADGFMFMGNWEGTQQKGEAMGYLPRDNKNLCAGSGS